MAVPLFYKGKLLSEHRFDLMVNNVVLVEVKSVNGLEPIHTAQVLTYLRVAGLRVGLILNFNNVLMKDGIRRIVL